MLSAIVGLLGGVSFGALLLRALVWALVFAALGFGAETLARRFLPEIFSEQAASPVGASEEAAPDAVDMTLGEENPYKENGEGLSSEPAVGETGSAEGPVAVPEDAEEVEELPAVAEEADIAEAPTVSDAEELPSLDGIDDSFGAASDSGTVSAGRESVDILGVEEDPEVVAKAVRTLMQRDREG